MVAITVVLAATIYVWVSGFSGGGGGGTAALSVTQLDSAGSDSTVEFQVNSASQGLNWDSINITVGTNGTTGDTFYSDYVTAGQTFTFHNVTTGETLKIVSTNDNSVLISKAIW